MKRYNNNFGHFMVGKGRITTQTKNLLELDCGCKLITIGLEGHVWHLDMDFSNCKDHKCGTECIQEKESE